MKHVLAGGLCAAALVCASTGVTAPAHADVTLAPTPAPTTATHATGLDLATARANFSDPSAARKVGPMQTVQAVSSVPAAHDLSSYALTAGNQGRVNSCVGWAVGYSGYGVLMNEEGITGAPMAPMYLYAQMVRGNDVGTWGGGVLKLATEGGIDTHAHYGPGDYDYTTQPSAAERANAASYKLSGYQELPLEGSAAKQAIMKAISSGSPVPIGMQIRSSFNDISSSDAVYRPSGAVVGGHETTIVGYDANGVKVLNSWGAGWGNRGYYTMPWNFVNWGDLTEMHAMGAVIGGRPLPTTDPTPSPTVTPTASPTPSPTVDPGPAGGNVLVNGDFENGQTPWQGNVARVTTTSLVAAHGGRGKLWLGGTGVASTQYMAQRFTVPANGRLSFWVHVETGETEDAAYDLAQVDLVDDANRGTHLAQFDNTDAQDGYRKVSADLSAHAGRTMWLRFQVFEDSNTISNFVFDDVTVS